MQVEIWSDVVCPFCYIGKRQLEAALGQLPDRDRVQVTWRSFELGPDTKTDPSRNAIQNLAEKKGWTLEFTRQAVADVAQRAQAVGLTFDYERTKVANTFDAHRLVHYATGAGKGDDVAEALFRAYFVEGRNVGDHATLAQLAAGAGLPEDEVREVLRSGRFADDVRHDLQTASTIRHQLGPVLRDRPKVRSERSAGQHGPASGAAASTAGVWQRPGDVVDLGDVQFQREPEE